MSDFANLQVQLELQTAEFSRGMKRVQTSITKMDKNVKKSTRSLQVMQKSLTALKGGLAGVAAGVAAAFSVQAVKNAIAYGDSVAKTADKIGIGVETLGALRFAADQSGVATTALDMAMQRFARRAAEARRGTGVLAVEFANLGIEATDSNGALKNTETLLNEYADAIKKAGDPTEQLRLSFKAFDSEGAALVNAMRNGSEGLATLTDKAREAGAVMNEDTARAAEILQSRFDAITNTLTNKLSTALINATAQVAAFFGVHSDAEALVQAMYNVDSAIRKTEDDLESASGRARRALKARLAALKETYEELQAQMPGLAAAQDQVAASTDDLTAKLTAGKSEAEKYQDKLKSITTSLLEAAEPGRAYTRKMIEIKDALVSGVIVGDEFLLLQQHIHDSFKKVEEVNPLVGFTQGILDSAEPLRVLEENMLKLMDAFDQGIIDGPQLATGIEHLQSKFEETKDAAISMGEEIKKAVEGFTVDFTNNIVDGLAEGKLHFDDFAEHVLKTLTKIVLNKVFEQFFTAISGSLGESLGGLFKSNTNPATGPTGRVRSGPTLPQTKSVVGVLKQPIYGGNRSSQARESSSGASKIIINNNAPVEVEARETQGLGGRTIEIAIEQAVNKQIGQGSFDKSFGASFGLKRRAY